MFTLNLLTNHRASALLFALALLVALPLGTASLCSSAAAEPEKLPLAVTNATEAANFAQTTYGLMQEYGAAKASGDLAAINEVLAKVNLRQDENGMNWSVADDAEDR